MSIRSSGSCIALVAALAAGVVAPAHTQSFRNADTVLRRMWQLGMQESQTERLAQVLTDSIGPRLSGSPGFASATEWIERTYQSWGVPVRREKYGTWRGWKQGAVHMDLIAPRTQSLEVKLLAWSPGTNRRSIEGEAIAVPELADSTAAQQWLKTVRGKFVLISTPEIMCRAPQELERWARPATVARIDSQRQKNTRDWQMRLKGFAAPANAPRGSGGIASRLDSAGVAGIVTMQWSGGWGVNKIFSATAKQVPTVDLSCEDYGLVYRLASNNQGPKLRLMADAEGTSSEVPMFNIVAELKGTEKPDEYVLLMAHLDSWHGATGATDNGTGTITMLEAMRILKTAYPKPKRTILVAHWGGEEQGALGSHAFGEDHPEVLNGLQVAFNQDNGTWRADTLEAQGFAMAGVNLARWVSQLPGELSDQLRLVVPGPQANSGSDHTSFICHGVPAFRLQSAYPEYRQYTWHTNRDTYDKIVFDDLHNNATLAAMLAYAASEDPERVPRDKSVLASRANGDARPWPTCAVVRRSYVQPG